MAVAMGDRRAVVMDNGSGFLKAGLAGDKEPTIIFPAVVGTRKPGWRVRWDTSRQLTQPLSVELYRGSN